MENSLIFGIMYELSKHGDLTFDGKLYEDDKTLYGVTLEDFQGFDENGQIIFRKYECPELVEELFSEISKEAEFVDSNSACCTCYFWDNVIIMCYRSNNV